MSLFYHINKIINRILKTLLIERWLTWPFLCHSSTNYTQLTMISYLKPPDSLFIYCNWFFNLKIFLPFKTFHVLMLAYQNLQTVSFPRFTWLRLCTCTPIHPPWYSSLYLPITYFIFLLFCHNLLSFFSTSFLSSKFCVNMNSLLRKLPSQP